MLENWRCRLAIQITFHIWPGTQREREREREREETLALL